MALIDHAQYVLYFIAGSFCIPALRDIVPPFQWKPLPLLPGDAVLQAKWADMMKANENFMGREITTMWGLFILSSSTYQCIALYTRSYEIMLAKGIFDLAFGLNLLPSMHKFMSQKMDLTGFMVAFGIEGTLLIMCAIEGGVDLPWFS